MYTNNLDDAFSAFASGATEEWVKSDKYMDYPEYHDEEYTYIEGRTIGDITAQVSVQGEAYSQYISFMIDRYYDGIDLIGMSIWIHYELKDGSGSEDSPVNVMYNDSAIRFGWVIPEKATQQSGDIKIGVWVNGTAPNTKAYILKTEEKIYTIHPGLIPGSGITQPDQNWFENFVVQMDNKVSTAQGYADDAQASRTDAAGSATAAAQSATASAQALQDNKAYVESQKETFVGYNKRETDLKYANALVGSASGMGGVTVGDAWEAPIPGMDISGKSEQFSTTGAQLLDLSAINKSAAGAVVNYADGGYSISGIGALTASFTVSCDLDIKKILKPGNLILKSELTVPKLYIRVWNGSTVLMEFQGNSTRQITQEIIDNENIRFECFLYSNAGNTITPGTYYPMLYQDGDGTWEPYTGGKPSPSPEYPQPIKGTGTVSSGAQILDLVDKTVKVYGITMTLKDGVSSLKGTATGSATLWYLGSYLSSVVLFVLPPGTYTVTDCRIWWSDGTTNVSKQGTFTIAEPFEVTGISTATYSTGSVVDETLRPMLNTGAAPKPWEPYTGGKPSPSSEYPQQLDVTVTGANLFDASKVPGKTDFGITFTNNGDGSFTTKGTATDYPNIRAVLLLPPGTYIASGTKGETNFFIRIFTNDKDYLDYHNTPFVITGNEYRVQAYIQVNRDRTASETIWPMINVGSTPLPWQPYQSRTAIITLTEPLHGIGDVRDRIMCRDGVWGVERYISQKKLTSDIVISSSGGVTTSNDVIDNRYTTINCKAWNNVIKKELYTNGKKTIGFCTIARPGIINDWNVANYGKENVYTINSLGTIYISIPISSIGITSDATRAEVTAAVKQYVTDHDVFVGFVLDIPTWEPLPSDTQSALNALTTYTGTTHVTIMAGGPEPDVGLEYVMDTNAVIAELKKLIEGMQNAKS